MRFLSLLPLLTLALAADPHVKVDGKTCTVIPIGGGQDDGPNIIYAFDACKSGGTVVLDKYYVVNTVLVITGLQDVRIRFSGVGESHPFNSRSPPFNRRVFSTIHSKYRILVPQLLLYGVPERVCDTHRSLSQTLTCQSTTFWFLSGNNIHLDGRGGTLDGNGQVWWDYPNKVTSLPSHPDRLPHHSIDCGNSRWFFHHLCTPRTPNRGQRLKRSHRRSHSNRFSFLGTSHSSIPSLINQSQ